MNAIRITFVFSLFLFSNFSIGQHRLPYDSMFINQISNQIKDEILTHYKNDSITIDKNCYYGMIDGEKLYLSCFEISWNLKWIGDINGDGEDDIVLRVEDDGLGGGGNAYGYDYYVVYLKDKKIFKTDTIWGGGKFSETFLNVDSVSDNTIFATLNENPILRSTLDTTTQFKEIKLQFVWNKNKVIEKSYLNCPFLTMDKRIFKPEIIGVIRILQSNELYEEEQQESLKSDRKKVIATYSGCKTFRLFFSIERPFDSRLQIDSLYKKEEMLKELSFLKDYTRFGDLIETITSDINKNGFFLQKTLPLPNGWSYNIGVSAYTYDDRVKSGFFINLTNKNAGDFREDIKQ